MEEFPPVFTPFNAPAGDMFPGGKPRPSKDPGPVESICRMMGEGVEKVMLGVWVIATGIVEIQNEQYE